MLREPAALHASFEFYRRLDETAGALHALRERGPVTIPVLAIGAEYSTGTGPADDMRKVADDVTGLVIPQCGHFLAEEAPEEVTAAMVDFLR